MIRKAYLSKIKSLEAIDEFIKELNLKFNDEINLDYKIKDSKIHEICLDRIKDLVKNDLLKNNPDILLKRYIKYFHEKKWNKKNIKKESTFYRARSGMTILNGEISSYPELIKIPYYDKEISAPPPLYVEGGRFNRAGVSYLYLATDIETAIAEIQLKVGEYCSIAQFQCSQSIQLLDLTCFNKDLETQIWYEILTYPIYDSKDYLVTQFLSDVFKKLEFDGIYFQSVQSKGDNIVSFNPEAFTFVEDSSKIIRTKKINYEYEDIPSSIDIFSTPEKMASKKFSYQSLRLNKQPHRLIQLKSLKEQIIRRYESKKNDFKE